MLFVCTGNIFRSMIAEAAMRRHLAELGETAIEARSAGLVARPAEVLPPLVELLRVRGLDVGAHRQTRVDVGVLGAARWIVAMGTDHRDDLAERFGIRAPLWNEWAVGRAEPILDVHERLPDWEQRLPEALRYVEAVVDHILTATPALAERLREEART